MQNHELANRLTTFRNSPPLQENSTITALLDQLIQTLQVPPGEVNPLLDIPNQLRNELKKNPDNPAYFKLALFLARYWSRNEKDSVTLKPLDSILLMELDVDDTINVLALSNGRIYDKNALVEHFKHVGGYSHAGEPQDDVNRERLSQLDIRHLEANGIVFLQPAQARRGRQDFIMDANLEMLRDTTGLVLTAPEIAGLLSGGFIGALIGTVALFVLMAFSPALAPVTLAIVLGGSALAGAVNLWQNWQPGSNILARIAHFGQGFLLGYCAQILTLSMVSLAAGAVIGLMGIIPAIPAATIATATALINLIQPWIPASLVAIAAISHALNLQTMNLTFRSIVRAPVLLAVGVFASIGLGIARMIHGTSQRPGIDPDNRDAVFLGNAHQGINARLGQAARRPSVMVEDDLGAGRQHQAGGALSPASLARMGMWNNVSESQAERGHGVESPRMVV